MMTNNESHHEMDRTDRHRKHDGDKRRKRRSTALVVLVCIVVITLLVALAVALVHRTGEESTPSPSEEASSLAPQPIERFPPEGTSELRAQGLRLRRMIS